MKRLTLLSLWLLIAICLGNNLFAALSNFSDSKYWTPYSFGSGPTIENTGDSFTATFPVYSHGGTPVVIGGYTTGTTDFGVGYLSTFRVSGDFTMDADYTLNTWGSGNGVRVGIWCAPWYTSQRVSWGGSPPGPECYVFAAGGISGIIGTAASSGTLRLSRTGTSLSGFYWDASRGWVCIGTGSFTMQDFQVSLEAWSHDGYFSDQSVSVTMGNVRLTPEVFAWPETLVPVPEPSTYIAGALMLLPFGFQGIRILRTRKA